MKRLVTPIIVALCLWLLIGLATVYGLFDRLEYRVFDQALRLRPQPPIEPSIITIDIDDPAISTVGRWPWSWDIHKEVFDFLHLQGIRHLFVLDLDLSKWPAYTLSAVEEGLLREAINKGDNRVLKALLKKKSPDNLLRQFAMMKEKAFLAVPAKATEGTKGTDTPLKITGIEDREVMKGLKGHSIEGTVKGILTIEDLSAPLRPFQDNTEGLGIKASVPDIDGVIRRYPMVLQYRGHLYPSIVLTAAMATLGAEGVNIAEGSLTLKARDRAYVIPIDGSGMLRVNWVGNYSSAFVHLPFNLIAQFVAVGHLKATLRGTDISKLEDPMALHERLIEAAKGLSILSEQDAQIKATVLFIASLLEPYILSGMTAEEALSTIGLHSGDSNLLAIARQVYLNNLVASMDRPPKDLQEALSLADIPLNEGEALRDAYEQLIYHLKEGKGLLALRPLYFEPSKILMIGDRQIRINPTFLKDKVVFYGLTATGLTAQNPSPFMDRHPLIDLPVQALNTVLTGRYLTEPPISFTLILMAFYIGIVSIAVSKTRPLKGLFVTLTLSTGHVAGYYLLILHKGIILSLSPAITALSSSYLLGLIIRYLKEYKERLRVRRIFSTMVSPEVLKILEARPDAVALKGELGDATVFSSDVSGFTTISEGVTAQELAKILNLYLTAMSNIIMSYDGYVDKYEGDAIKAVFGVPLPDHDHPWKACCAALLQQEELKIIQKMILLKYGVLITARMGINSGMVYAGNMGSARRVQYTVMGETVHIAEELEPANKVFGTWIAAAEETQRRADGFIVFRSLGEYETSDGLFIKAHEVLGCDPERFMDYYKDRPVSDLLLEPYKRLSPLRVLGSLSYLIGLNARLGNPLLNEIVSVFEKLRADAMDYLRLEAKLGYLNFHNRLATLSSRYSIAYPLGKVSSPEERLQDLSMLLQGLLGRHKAPSEEEVIEIDALQKTLTSFQKRLSIETRDNEAIELADYIKGLLLQEVGSEKTDLITRQMATLSAKIAKGGSDLTERIRANPREFHLITTAALNPHKR